MGESLESISPRSITDLSPDAGGAEKRQSGRDGVAIRSVRPDAHNASGFADSLSLSPEARNQLRELQQRDAEVRAHEQAHLAAGGPHVTGGASYTYQKGPDGRQYAIGGQVSIDTSAVPGDPEATREKGRQVRRAALAPGEPSGQDQQVAAKAARLEAEAAGEEQADSLEERRRTGASSLAAHRDRASVGTDFAATGAPADAAPSARIDRPGEPTPGDETGGIDAHRNRDTFQPAARAQDRAASMAADAYAAMSMRGTLPTTLAPNGTGISLEV